MSWICKGCRTVVEESGQAMESTNCPVCGTALENDAPQRSVRQVTPTAFGRYELKICVGTGHFGNVWLAFDTKLKRDVALKLPRFIGAESRDQRMFLREAQAAAHLNHPGIATVFEVGEEGNCVYIVSEYVSGGSLQTYLKENTPTIPQAVNFTMQLARALEHAHSRHVIHRDLKPGNILVTEDQKLKISDFGLAKKTLEESDNTKEGDVFGTPAYMAPEQARGLHSVINHQADLYALGVIFYEMLTGKRPFNTTDYNFAQQLQTADPPLPSQYNSNVDKELERICLGCLKKNPADRYESAAQIEQELLQWQTDNFVDRLADTVVPAEDLSSARNASSGLSMPGITSKKDAHSSATPISRQLKDIVTSSINGSQSVTQSKKYLHLILSSVFTLSMAAILYILFINGVHLFTDKGSDQSAPPTDTVAENGDRIFLEKSSDPLSILPKLVNVRIVTDPPNASVTVWGFHPIFGILDESQFFPGESRSPVEMKLPPGDFMVVAALDNGAFHEVIRHVPRASDVSPLGVRHRMSTLAQDGFLELRPIDIPEVGCEEGMALFKETLGFQMGTKRDELSLHIRNVPAFYLDTQEVTFGEIREEQTGKIYLSSFSGNHASHILDNDFPVSRISWDDALQTAEVKGKRLMFESEYEVAATNASTTRFPWGNDSDRLEPWDYGPVRHPEYDTVHTGTKEVFGLFSNVGEWTMTPMSLYPTLQGKGYNLELSTEEYVVRGGDLGVLRGTKPTPSLAIDGPKFRAFINKQEMHRGIGFRCARSRQPRLTRNTVEKIVPK